MSCTVPEGDTQQIWAEFSDRLRAFIRRRVESAADAEDILQEVFLRIHRHAGTVERQERFVSWLFQVTRNAITDYYRAPVRRRELPAGAVPDYDEAVESTGAGFDDGDDASGQAGRELAHCLRPMVARLPPHYREAVTLVDLEGRSQQDAATQAGLSLSGMKSRVQRGRRALEGLLRECCQIDLDAGGRIMQYHPHGEGCGTCADGCRPS